VIHLSSVGGEYYVVEIQRIIKIDNRHITYFALSAQVNWTGCSDRARWGIVGEKIKGTCIQTGVSCRKRLCRKKVLRTGHDPQKFCGSENSFED